VNAFSASTRRVRWALTRRALDGLLRALDPDEHRAADRYERLRQGLIVFFLGHGVVDAEARADETLDRVSRRIDEGTPIRNLGRFAYGVARRVCSESLRRDRRQRAAVRALPTPLPAPAEDSAEVPQECIRRCMAALDPDDRALILCYYEGQGKVREKARRALAEGLGLSATALRLRAYRIRRTLAPCVRRCLASGARRE